MPAAAELRRLSQSEFTANAMVRGGYDGTHPVGTHDRPTKGFPLAMEGLVWRMGEHIYVFTMMPIVCDCVPVSQLSQVLLLAGFECHSLSDTTPLVHYQSVSTQSLEHISTCRSLRS